MTLKSSTQLLYLVLRTQVQVSWVSVRLLAPAAASCLLEDTDAFEIVKAPTPLSPSGCCSPGQAEGGSRGRPPGVTRQKVDYVLLCQEVAASWWLWILQIPAAGAGLITFRGLPLLRRCVTGARDCSDTGHVSIDSTRLLRWGCEPPDLTPP